jgi:O-antigen/teichoic acid export membrane protein
MRKYDDLNEIEINNVRRDSTGKSITLTYFFAFASSIIGFLIVIVFSRLLTPDEWGAFSVAKRAATLTATIALLGISVAITRYIPMEKARGSKFADYYSTNALNLVIRSTAAILIVWPGGLFLFTSIGVIDDALIKPLYAATIFIVALMWQLFFTSLLRAEGYILRFNQMTVMGQLLQMALGTFALVIIGATAYVVILGSATGIVIVVGLSLVLIMRLGITLFQKPFINNDVRSEIMSYGIPRMAMGMSEVLVISSSLILLGFAGMTVEAGFLAIGLQFVSMMALSFQPIAVVMLPEFSRLFGLAHNEEIEHKIQILIQGWLYTSILIIVLLYSFIDHVFPVIFKAEYMPAIQMIKIILIGMVPFSFYLTTYSYINAVVKRPYLLYFLISAVIVNVLLYFLLIPVLGGIGAAVATTGGMVTLGIMVTKLFLKYQPKAFAGITITDFLYCNTPLMGVVVLSFMKSDIYVQLFLSLVLLVLYGYFLRARKLMWFEIIINNILARK